MANFPDWVVKHKQKGTEIRKIKGHYYLYRITSRWDKQKKRPVKVTLGLLGKITPEGFIPSEKHQLKEQVENPKNLSTKEYGITALIEQQFDEFVGRLKDYFPQLWRFILALSYCRFVYHSPMKRCDLHWTNSFLSEVYGQAGLSSSKLSEKLRQLGGQRQKIVEFLRSFVIEGESILFDGSDLLSKSENMSYPKTARSKKGTFEQLMNLMFIFSVDRRMPLYYRLLPGNVRDVKAFRLSLEESGIKEAIVIADKGFYSRGNVELLRSENLEYILPLKRNSSLIDYSVVASGDLGRFDGYFRYQDKVIWYYEYRKEDQRIIVYLNERLRNQEINDYLHQLEKRGEDIKNSDFYEKQYQFGTLAITTNSERSAQQLYINYKSRHQIEQMIDVLKNLYQADSSYMQDERALEGWMFVNYVVLYWHYKLVQLLTETGLAGKYSVEDILSFLREVRKIRINDRWFTAEITKKDQKLLEQLNLHIHIV